ncbi:MAG: formate-dependent nitrite reductase cytochrome c552 subunit [Cognaticolwellia sp.]|jgi:formate-dependent nitrite reductase cytochrome c552 subunit
MGLLLWLLLGLLACETGSIGAHQQDCAQCHQQQAQDFAASRLSQSATSPLFVAPVRGPTGSSPGAPHDTLAGDFSNSSELCGTCHDVAGPAGFEESPYAHWQQAAQALPAPQGCADCHMQQGHRFEGLWSAGAPELLALAMRLELAREGDTLTVTVHNDNPGHNLPDGASYLRRLSVNVDGQAPI